MHKGYSLVDGKPAESAEADSPIELYSNPTPEEKAALVSRYGLDEHTLNSALDPDEPARLEFEQDHVAVIFNRPKNYSAKDHFLFKVSSVGLFLFKTKLVIVMSDDIPMFTGKMFRKSSNLQELFLKQIYASIYHFLEHLRVINMISDELETQINISMENKSLLNLFSLEKSLVYYVNAINSNGIVFEKLRSSNAKIGFSQECMELLEDIIIENQQCAKQAEIYANILTGLMDARASIVNNNLNLLMKTLTIITLLIMVPTLVVSIFSMNVQIPLQGHPYAFWIILMFAIAPVLVIMLLWRKKRW
ncbi:MAG: magnesium transporter CorA family protein [Elusimicrobia bacterium]|nr:magnesium transporter CorA family protein [Elusimicrobiota bacterium]